MNQASLKSVIMDNFSRIFYRLFVKKFPCVMVFVSLLSCHLIAQTQNHPGELDHVIWTQNGTFHGELVGESGVLAIDAINQTAKFSAIKGGDHIDVNILPFLLDFDNGILTDNSRMNIIQDLKFQGVIPPEATDFTISAFPTNNITPILNNINTYAAKPPSELAEITPNQYSFGVANTFELSSSSTWNDWTNHLNFARMWGPGAALNQGIGAGAGFVVGAAIGSIIPGPGTVVGGVIGSLATTFLYNAAKFVAKKAAGKWIKSFEVPHYPSVSAKLYSNIPTLYPNTQQFTLYNSNPTPSVFSPVTDFFNDLSSYVDGFENTISDHFSSFSSSLSSWSSGFGSNLGGIDFRQIELKGMKFDSTSNQLEFVFGGDTVQLGDSVIDPTSKADLFHRIFTAALTVPNQDHYISLDVLPNPLRGSARATSPFDSTEMAQIFWEADVFLKYDGVKYFWSDSASSPPNKWVQLVQRDPFFWSQLNSAGYLRYPSMMVRQWILPGEIFNNQTGGRVFIDSVKLDLGVELEELSLDMSGYNFSPALENYLNESIDSLRSFILIQLAEMRDSIITKMNGDSPEYFKLREIMPAIVAARWYKAEASPNSPLYEIIDQNLIKGAEAYVPHSKPFWDSLAYHTLDTLIFQGFGNVTQSLSIKGGCTMDQLDLRDSTLIPVQDTIYGILDTAAFTTLNDQYFFDGLKMSSSLPELFANGIQILPNDTNITLLAKNEPALLQLFLGNRDSLSDSGPFSVVFYEGPLDSNYANVGQLVLGTVFIPNLSPQQDTIIELTCYPSSEGLMKVSAFIDPQNNVRERLENNNEIWNYALVFDYSPRAPIVFPQAGQAVPSTSVKFICEVYPGNDTASTSLLWESNIDGVLNEDSVFFFADSLTPGTHLITLTIQNSLGFVSSSQSIIYVYPDGELSAYITQPNNGDTILGEMANQLMGMAFNDQGNSVCNSLVWESSVDGYIGLGCNPNFSFTPGNHILSMTATDGGDTLVQQVNIYVIANTPTLDITSPQTNYLNVTEVDSVTLSGLAIDPQQGDLSSQINWFSDIVGFLGVGDTIKYAFNVGRHKVEAIISDEYGLQKRDSILVNSSFSPPEVHISQPPNLSIFQHGASVQFLGNAIDPQDGNIGGSSFSWHSSVEGYLGTGNTLNISSLIPGTHDIILEAHDSDGAIGQDTISITIDPGFPSAVISSPVDSSISFSGFAVLFQGTGTDPQDGQLAGNSLVWTSSLDGFLGTGDSVEIYSLSSGTHMISLQVQDSDSWTDVASVNLNIIPPRPPSLSILQPNSGSNAMNGDLVTFIGRALDPEDGHLFGTSLVWSSNLDGFIGNDSILSTSSLSRGLHNITLTGYDVFGDSSSATIVLEVLNQPPTVSIIHPLNRSAILHGDYVTLQGSGSDFEDGNLTGGQLTWTSSLDGVIGTGDSIVTNNLSPGQHLITFQGQDSDGGIQIASINLFIQAGNASSINELSTGDTVVTFVVQGGLDTTLFVELPGNSRVVSAQATVRSSYDYQEVMEGYYNGALGAYTYSNGFFPGPFALGDLNGDGLQDMIQSNGSSLRQYDNIGTSTNPVFTPGNPDLVNVSITGVCPALVDINADGDLDLFMGTDIGSLVYFENVGTSTNPVFSLVTLNYLGTSAYLNQVPVFEDIDADGDKDLFIGEQGGSIVYFRNMGNSTNPNFVFQTASFGGINVGGNAAPGFVDIEADGDLDLWVGSNGGAVNYYFNIGNASNPVYSAPQGFLGPNGSARAYPSWYNLDGDSDFDFFMAYGNNYNITIYTNIGSATGASFGPSNPMVIQGTIDAYLNSSPTMGDLDNDGDYDLIVGHLFYGMYFYRNDGNNAQPNWVLVSTNYAGFNGTNIFCRPDLVDIDNDNDLDLFVGDGGGNLIFIRNEGNPSNPIWNIVTTNYIPGNNFFNPTFVDIDGDGDKDLISGLGQGSGNMVHYQNTGTPSNPSWSLVTTNFGNVSVSSNPHPEFGDYDQDGDYDMLLGDEFGSTYMYENWGDSTNPVWAYRGQYYASTFLNAQLPNPCWVDIDSDRDLDLFLGNSTGGLSFFENQQDPPFNVNMDVGNDGVIEWYHPGGFYDDTIMVSGFEGDLNDYLDSLQPSSNPIQVPIRYLADSTGKLVVFDIFIQYLDADLNPPTILTASILPDTVQAGANTTVNATVIDNDSVGVVEVSVAGNTTTLLASGGNNYSGTINVASPGSFNCLITAYDIGGLSSDTTLGIVVQAVGPELEVSIPDSIALSPMNELTVQQIPVLVSNVGDQTAGNFLLEVKSNGVPVNSVGITSLSPGDTLINVPFLDSTGWIDLIAIVDVNGQVAESNEFNNSDTLAIFLKDITPPTIDSVKNDPILPVTNQGINIQVWTSDNVGVETVWFQGLGQTDTLIYNSGTNSFEGSISGVPSGLYHLMIQAVDSSGLSSVTTHSIRILPSSPDLTINQASIQLDTGSLQAGQLITVRAQIENQSGVSVGPFDVLFEVDNVQEDLDTITLQPGEIREVQFPWTVVCGTIDLGITVDPYNQITETNETNNSADSNFTTCPPSPPSIVNIFTQPSQVFEGDSFTVAVLLASNPTVDSVFINFNGQLGGLTPDSVPDQYVISLQAPVSGSYPVLVTAYGNGGNSSQGQINLTINPMLPDLALVSIQGTSPVIPYGLGTIALLAEVNNQGALSADSVKVLMSVNGQPFDSTWISLASGTIDSVYFPWYPPLGTQLIEIVVDPDSSISELLEVNNRQQRNAEVRDLEPPLISSIAPSGGMHAGGSFDLISVITDLVGVDTVIAIFRGNNYPMLPDSNGVYKAISIPSGGADSLPITIRAWDVSGLTAQATQTVVISDTLADLIIYLHEIEIHFTQDTIVELKVPVKNIGGGASGNIQVVLALDSVQVFSQNISLLPGQVDTITYITALSHGLHYVEAVSDAANIVLEIDEINNTAGVNFNVADLTPPPSPVVSMSPPGWASVSSGTSSWAAVSDPSGIMAYWVAKDGEPMVNIGLALNYVLSDTNDGWHCLRVYAQDSAGNISQPGLGCAGFDRKSPEAPVVTENHCGDSWTNHDSPFLTWPRPADPGSGVEFYEVQVDGGTPYSVGDSLYHDLLLASGIHNMRVRAIDSVGHQSQWSNLVEVYIDGVSPILTGLNSPSHPNSNQWYSNKVVDFVWSVPQDQSGIEGYYYIFNTDTQSVPIEVHSFVGDSVLRLSTLISATDTISIIPDGEWYLHVVSRDSVGNFSPVLSYLVRLDSTPPVTDVFVTADTLSYVDTVLLNPLDMYSGVMETRYRINNGNWNIGEIVEGLQCGDNLIEFYSTDHAGNTESIDTLFVYIEDSLDYQLMVSNPSCHQANDGSITIAVSNFVGPVQYTWLSHPSLSGPGQSSLFADSYMVAIEDSIGCKDTILAEIAEPLEIITMLDSLVSPICNGDSSGEIYISALGGQGGLSYSWSHDSLMTDSSLTGLAGGIYQVISTDQSGCRDTISVTVPEPSVLFLSMNNSNPTCNNCNNGTAAVHVAGGIGPYTYVWSTQPPQFADSISNLADGVYAVTVTDANGCEMIDSVGLVNLPVELWVVSARLDGEDVVVKWTTVDEFQIDEYVIQRSLDNLNFKDLGLSLAQNQTGLNRYSFVDQGAAHIDQSIIYYRVVKYELDGSYEYSRVIDVPLNGAASPMSLVLFPNPVKEVIWVELTSPEAKELSIVIRDSRGKEVGTVQKLAQKGPNSFEIDLTGIATGIYVIELYEKNKRLIEGKFVKQ